MGKLKWRMATDCQLVVPGPNCPFDKLVDRHTLERRLKVDVSCHQKELSLEKSDSSFSSIGPGSSRTSGHHLDTMACVEFLKAVREKGHITDNCFRNAVILVDPLSETLKSMLLFCIGLGLRPKQMSCCIEDEKNNNSSFVKLELSMVNKDDVSEVDCSNA